MRLGVVAAVAVLIVTIAQPAQAAPAHPGRWVQHEAQRMGCQIEHRERVPMGPSNRGVSCHVGDQRYDVLYYRRIGDAIDWWRHWIRSSDTWFARDGLVLVIPEGSTRAGVDSGLYQRTEAEYAARQLGGRVLAA